MELTIGMRRVCGWSGVGFLALFTAGWWVIAQFVPPHNPLNTGPEVAAEFATHHIRILIGMCVYLMGTALVFPFFGGVAVHLKHIEEANRRPPFWTVIFLLANVFAMLTLFMSVVFWATIAYRPERSPELILLINDFNWMLLVWDLTPPLMMYLAAGIVILTDRTGQELFPRWTGYASIWFSVLSLPAIATPFFMRGPFAWNGLFSFWLSAFCFGNFISIFVMRMLKIKSASASVRSVLTPAAGH